MELLPTSAPVYGGGLVVAFLPEDYTLPEDIRAFLVFKGSRQRQITEAKISFEDTAFHAVVPDHEPPEQVELSAYTQSSDGIIRCLASEGFSYYLDQTCYLARYLADSVHHLESLEDWDGIRGDSFSLEQEDFGSLDERLTSAFQHLILPSDWSLLGDAATAHIPRETLFHFAARLGLSTFVTLLLEKPGAEACLHLFNRHNELARDIALSRGFDGLADLIKDPHAHGVIKWESKEEIGDAIILTRHSFGTVSTSSEIKDGTWPSIDMEIEALSHSSCPPDTPIPFGGMNLDWDGNDTSLLFPQAANSDLDVSHDDYYPSTFATNNNIEINADNSKEDLLGTSLHHLHGINEEIHYLRHQDIDKLQEDEDTGRLSNSCPDLVQEIFSGEDKVVTAENKQRAPSVPITPQDKITLSVESEATPENQIDRRSYSVLEVEEKSHGEDEGRRHTFSEVPASKLSLKQLPIVPLRPAKRLVTRKLSFLEKMRSSARTKAKDKEKTKAFAELKFGKAKNEETYKFTEDAKNADRSKRPSILTTDRPRSMMINRPPHYSLGPAPGNFPVMPAASRRPISVVSSFDGNAERAQPTLTRTNFGEEEDGSASTLFRSSRPLISDSCESLDEADRIELEADPDLARPDEADSWSSSIDKKGMKKLSLSKKDVKRQENIYEFILTERNHLTTLKIMQKVYARGMLNELHMDQTTVDKIFPLIDEHVECVSQLVRRLIERQNVSKVVSGIGDILVEHWEGGSGETVKRLFGDFCSKQTEITNFYKDLMKTDKKLQLFMKKYEKKSYTRRQDVLACALLITQRLTKYPIMLQTMLENSNKKDHREDYTRLERALEFSREIAKDVDEQVQARERKIFFMDVYDRTESKSTTTLKDRRFDRKDFLKRGRKLLYSANMQLVKENRKCTDIFLLLLTDCIMLLQESNGRYNFPSGQPAAIPLQKMIVREVASDERSLYLMSMSTQQMYTLKLSTSDQCKTLTNSIRLAIGKSPDEDEEMSSEDEGDQRMDKARQIIKQLELTDQRIIRTLEEKMSYFRTLAETVGQGEAIGELHFSFRDHSTEEERFPAGKPLLLKAIEQVSKVVQAFYGPGDHLLLDLEERSSLPKRSDTFGGFDNGKDSLYPRAKYLNSSQSDSKLCDLEQEELSSFNRDSGFHSELAMSSHGSIPRSWESSSLREHLAKPESTHSVHLPRTPDQVEALTCLAHILSRYQSFAAQQDTRLEKQNLQLSGKKRLGGGGLQEAELKRNQVKQQEQMDDLRKQQQQLRSEREQWQKQVERFQKSLDAEKAECDREKERVEKEKAEMEKQRMENEKTKDFYNRELMRLKGLQRQTQHDVSSTSQLPGNKNNSSNVEQRSRSQSNLQSPVAEVPDDKHLTFAEGDYPRTYPSHKRDSSNAPSQQLPIHMQYSIVNQQATSSQKIKQQDMTRLATKLASTSKPTSLKPGSSEKSGRHQLIPNKLTKSHSGSTSKKHHIV